MPPLVTVGVLSYGDHADLARRCLDSIVRVLTPDVAEIRVGLNAVAAETNAYVDQLLAADQIQRVYESSQNLRKYPLMRRMLHDPDAPPLADCVMWFDDDSFLRPGTDRRWLTDALAMLRDHHMLGSRYYQRLRGRQHLWIADQPWYGGKPVPKNFRVSFATGGWWMLRASVLRRFDWPWASLDHRGGDVMLGELLRQHDLSLGHFRSGVAINADAEGRECKAARRGFDSAPAGYDYDPGAAKGAHTVLMQTQLPPI